MNINTLRKNYDKLNSAERFAAIVAAASRDDEQEGKALLQSAPKKRFSVPHTWGLSQAFQFLSMRHMMNQLGYAASFYFALLAGDESEEVFDGIMAWLKKFLTDCEAWRATCKEYGVDALGSLEGAPFAEILDFTEMLARQVYDVPLDLPELQETIDGLRSEIERKRKEWE